jgi:chromosome segregation ATPase
MFHVFYYFSKNNIFLKKEQLRISAEKCRRLENLVKSYQREIAKNRTAVETDRIKLIEMEEKINDLCNMYNTLNNYYTCSIKEKLDECQIRKEELEKYLSSLNHQNSELNSMLEEKKEKITILNKELERKNEKMFSIVFVLIFFSHYFLNQS